MYREQEHIKSKKPLLYSLGSSDEERNRNIRLNSTSRVLIKMPHEVGDHEWAEYRVLLGEKYIPPVNEPISGHYTHGVGVSTRVKKCEDWRSVWKKRLGYCRVLGFARARLN